MKLITESSFFNLSNIKKLPENGEYAIGVVDQVFVFRKTSDFIEKLSYTLKLSASFGNKDLLESMFSKNYENRAENILKMRGIAASSKMPEDDVILAINIDTLISKKIYLKSKRNQHAKAEIRLNDLLQEKNLELPQASFREKTPKVLGERAKNFLNKNAVYRKFIDFNSDYFPGVGIEFFISDKYLECGYGRSETFNKSYHIALLEAVERYTSLYFPYKNKEIYGSFSSIPNAISPDKFILASSEQNPFQSYRDDLKIYWTEAESLREDKTVLIPEQLAVFGDSFFRGREKQNRFVYDSSNGASLGASFEEAVLYGLLELVERDNFLTTWYGEIPMKEVDLDFLGLEGTTLNIIHQAKKEGLDVKLFDISMELGVPSFWALIRSKKSQNFMYAYTAAGSNPAPSTAANSALLEALVGIKVHENFNREHGIQSADKVKEFEDHVNYYATNKAKKAYDFVEEVESEKLSDDKFIQSNNSLSYLKDLVQKVLANYEDIFVVNLTTEEMKRLGLFSVKVLVPGMLPMTFGLQNERVSLDRINKERRRRGLKDISEINKYPHPFP